MPAGTTPGLLAPKWTHSDLAVTILLLLGHVGERFGRGGDFLRQLAALLGAQAERLQLVGREQQALKAGRIAVAQGGDELRR